MASNPKHEHTVAEATFAPFRFSFRLCVALVLLWASSVAMQIAYIHWNHVQPDEHMTELIDFYVAKSPAKGFVESAATTAHWIVFEATEAQRRLLRPPEAKRDDKLGKAVKRGFWAAFQPQLRTMAWATVLFGAKVGIMLLAIPIFIVLMAVATVDGLVQRYVRKACGGHESAALYHRAKLYGMKLLPPFAAVIFLCVPVSFDPAWVFVPTAVLSALLLRVQATYYKKYL